MTGADKADAGMAVGALGERGRTGSAGKGLGATTAVATGASTAFVSLGTEEGAVPSWGEKCAMTIFAIAPTATA